jgi:hypothetical protein
MNTNDFLTKTGNVLRKVTLRVAFILKLMLISQSGLIASVIFLTVGVNYFFCAFADNYEGEVAALDRFFIKLYELSSSVTCVGILFRLQNWPNNISFLTVGIVTIGISFGYLYFRRNQVENNYVYRIIALLGIAIILFLVTSR